MKSNFGFKGRNKQAGVTLIELMIAIAIGLVIAAITIGTAGVVRKDQRTSELQQQVVVISSQLQALGKGGGFQGINTELLIDSGKIPLDWVTGSGTTATIKHAFGGTFTALPANVNATNDGAAVVVSRVDTSACVSLLTNTQNIFAIIKGTGVGKINGAAPLTPVEIVATCKPASSGNTVDLTLTVV